ncbi:MAG TPA: P27 family phage terminase small subunit [Gemmatimonadales bacterium]
MVANRKPEGTRQDNKPGRELATVHSISGGQPAVEMEHRPTPGWLKATRDQWADFWEADVAKVLARHHVPALYRLFELRDAQARALRLYKKQPMVDGSMKQPVVNPAMSTVQALEKDIRALEDRLGLTPKAQANLGIQIGQARLTAAELNRMAAGEDDDDRGGSDPERVGDGEPDDVLEADWVEA